MRTRPDGHTITTFSALPSSIAAVRISDAAAAVATAQAVRPRELEPVAQAKILLHRAVDDARDAGMTWGAIAKLLDISRGAAIKRYHHPGERNSTPRFGALPL